MRFGHAIEAKTEVVSDTLIPKELLDLLREIAERNDHRNANGLKFTFVSYSFDPGAYALDLGTYRDRETLVVKADELGGEKMVLFFEAARQLGHDVTLSSRVEFEPSIGWIKPKHIPMIDFDCDPDAPILSELHEASILSQIDLEQFLMSNDTRYFASGRSFHGYGTKLLNEDELVPFLGRLLLMNIPEHKSVVDQRWVGHRLVKGYMALRWTKNNPKYLKVPEEIECPF